MWADLPSAPTLPDALVDRPQWLCWRTETRDGTETKVPIDPRNGHVAAATDPDTWVPFTLARDAAGAVGAGGLGFAFATDDPLVGIDLDDCRDPKEGHVDDWALELVDELDSYTEVSPSGTGLHVILAGDLPEGRNRRGHVECYDRNRYFTVTGDHLPGTPDDVESRPEALVEFHEAYLGESSTGDVHSATDSGTPSREDCAQLSDGAVLARARHATNGRKFSRLWAGNTGGYESHSEADMALCCLLAFWTARDAAQLDRLYRQSGLYRDKWDEVHYADGSTYGEKTIERAIRRTSEVYESSTGVEIPDRLEERFGAPVPALDELADQTERDDQVE